MLEIREKGFHQRRERGRKRKQEEGKKRRIKYISFRERRGNHQISGGSPLLGNWEKACCFRVRKGEFTTLQERRNVMKAAGKGEKDVK